MNTVMRRRVEDFFEDTHFVDGLCMNPKLIQEIKGK